MAKLAEHRRRLDRLMADRRRATERLREERTAVDEATRDLEEAQQAAQVLQEIAQGIQEQAHRQIAAVVTRALQAVWEDEAYEFSIIFEKKRGRTEARLVFLRDGNEVDPMDASGGGCVDVASFALRLACLLLERPQRRKLLVLDEPWKHVSRDKRPQIKAMVEQLARDFGVQFIIVTHDAEFRMGKVVEL